MQARSNRAYPFIMVLTGLMGVGLFAGVYAFAPFDPSAFWNLIVHGAYQSPALDLIPKTWFLTPLYAVPIVTGLCVSRRLGLPGAVWLMVAMTGAHWLAQAMAMEVIGWLKELEDGHERLVMMIIGAVGGFIGAFLSFLALIPLHQSLRQARSFKLYGLFILLLCLAATVSFAFLNDLSNKAHVALVLYAPWQALFSVAIAFSFGAVPSNQA